MAPRTRMTPEQAAAQSRERRLEWEARTGLSLWTHEERQSVLAAYNMRKVSQVIGKFLRRFWNE